MIRMPATLNRRHVISLAGAAAAGLALAGNASAQSRSAEATIDAAKVAEPASSRTWSMVRPMLQSRSSNMHR